MHLSDPSLTPGTAHAALSTTRVAQKQKQGKQLPSVMDNSASRAFALQAVDQDPQHPIPMVTQMVTEVIPEQSNHG